jgi:predicted transcriptional regulator
MSTLTVRLPDDTHDRLRELAKQRGISINKLMEELSIIAVAQHDAETRFRALAAKGAKKKGLAVLAKLDKAFQTGG